MLQNDNHVRKQLRQNHGEAQPQSTGMRGSERSYAISNVIHRENSQETTLIFFSPNFHFHFFCGAQLTGM